ncbi:Lrp/AsnC family transcriptional regulator [Pseudonocardia kujensis]|uniref:Lrp/AsnC family transcriptional regulator n=1 Tax=Pseudonocardia kujensis TaxID=1128675 RepID=UPI001E343A2F|nr:Lrp/AsnC family transcriptional regulator [Pseudonocardia kujensis]MCE0764934.1 Lrp/AsnC family transcriptional regulator [Pseudonocardia kujensis]
MTRSTRREIMDVGEMTGGRPHTSLDETDRGIIRLLLEDGRMSVRRIADNLSISAPTAHARLDKLRGSGTVRIVGLVDPAVLGRPVVAFLTITVCEDVYEVAKRVTAHQEILWATIIADFQTILAQVSVADNADLLDLVDHQIRAIEGVDSARADIGLRSYSTAFRFGFDVPVTAPSQSHVPWLSGGTSKPLDEVDRTILRELQRDGRTTFAALAELVGLSVPAARQRYLRLVEGGLLRIQCRPSIESLGLHAVATLGVEVTSSSAAVAQELAALPEATWVTEASGKYHIRAELVCADPTALARTLSRVRGLAGVRSVRVFLHQEIVKSAGRWS